MHFTPSRSDVVRSINQRWLLSHWNRVRGDALLPIWKDLAAEQLARISDTLTFQDVVSTYGNPRFLIRFHGARIGEAYGANCQGRYLDQILPEAFRQPALATYYHVVATKLPVYTVVDTRDRDGRLVHYERLLLPFSRNGINVDRILASLETVSPEGAFENRNIFKAPTTAPNYSLCATISIATEAQ